MYNHLIALREEKYSQNIGMLIDRHGHRNVFYYVGFEAPETIARYTSSYVIPLCSSKRCKELNRALTFYTAPTIYTSENQ